MVKIEIIWKIDIDDKEMYISDFDWKINKKFYKTQGEDHIPKSYWTSTKEKSKTSKK